ncbi:ATP-dependent 6-phosphofructokinase [Rickettsiales bacterium LUAb2]
MSEIKKIGILTSGGDCAGLNAAIAAATKRAILGYGWEVYGIVQGTMGLMNRPLNYIKLSTEMFGIDLTFKGGSFIGSVNKGDPLNYPMPDGSFKDRSDEIVAGYKELGIDALVAIGGDGSMRIIEKLTSLGNIKFVGIPKTIDNDVACTNYAIGFMTAVQEVTNCIERIHDTAMSHRRFIVVETMGREVGHIALNAGIAGCADVILIPEIPYDINIVVKKLKAAHAQKGYGVIVCSEAIIPKGGTQSFTEKVGHMKLFTGAGQRLGQEIETNTGIETRVSVLGHIQRGGRPIAFDRNLASAFGVRAVDLLANGKTGRLVALNAGQIVDMDLKEVNSIQQTVKINGNLVTTAKGLGISFGDE